MAAPIFTSNGFSLKCLLMSKRHTEQMDPCPEGSDCLEVRAMGQLFRASSTTRSWLQLLPGSEKKQSPPQTSSSGNVH